jgi:hypothetical protein
MKNPWTVRPLDNRISINVYEPITRDQLPLLIQQLERVTTALTVYRLYLQQTYSAISIPTNAPTTLVENVFLGTYFTIEDAEDHARQYTNKEVQLTDDKPEFVFDNNTKVFVVKERGNR